MTPVLQQMFTLVGVLFGATASFVSTGLAERARWRRSLASRWDDKRLDAYSQYANAVKTSTQLSLRVAAARGLPSGAQPADLTEGLEAVAAAEADRTAKWEAVLLLGDPATISAARAWHEYGWELESFARGELTDPDDFQKCYRNALLARSDFYAAARADLGVLGGSGSPAAELPRGASRFEQRGPARRG